MKCSETPHSCSGLHLYNGFFTKFGNSLIRGHVNPFCFENFIRVGFYFHKDITDVHSVLIRNRVFDSFPNTLLALCIKEKVIRNKLAYNDWGSDSNTLKLLAVLAFSVVEYYSKD